MDCDLIWLLGNAFLVTYAMTSEKMRKNEKRAAITYWHMKGLQAQQIHKDMKEVLADNALSPATVYRWFAKLKRGRQSTEDEHCSGHPV